MDSALFKGSAKIYMKTIVEKCKKSMEFLKDNPSLETYLNRPLCQTAK